MPQESHRVRATVCYVIELRDRHSGENDLKLRFEISIKFVAQTEQEILRIPSPKPSAYKFPEDFGWIY